MTPPDDVSERLEAIRERQRDRPSYVAEAANKYGADAAWLLSRLEEVRDQLCKYTCECGPASNTDPEAHADYCLYRSALRDAAQERADE